MNNKGLTFLEWLDLDIDSITWEGRNKEQFFFLWEEVLCSENIFVSLTRVINELQSSPLKRWFVWLQEMNMNYSFFLKDYSVTTIAQRSDKPINEVNIILRSYFLYHYPLEVELADEVFSSGNILYTNVELKFETSLISAYRKVTDVYKANDVMKEIEVTLMSGWKEVVKFLNLEKPKKKIRYNFNYLFNYRFIKEVILLSIIGIFIIFVTRFGNKLYEDKILSEVSILRTDFLWLDKEISYQKETPASEEITLNSKDLEELEKNEDKLNKKSKVADNLFVGESDVVLTSVNSLPKDFNSASLEQSKYEEIKERGYRDNRYGRARAYRILINSIDGLETKKKIKEYIKKFNLTQVDNVLPGTTIPGGFYYNLYVSSDTLKDFMSKLNEELEVTVYESRTAFSAPKDMNKIFIWIKLI